ncbi:hypothetical protein JR316_0010847 [Psilocybe cubensis]|uniref:Mid2 domain-containing protein n=2 Tax=Psilocybe cubensis TaxID=181762 RepID=A0A8H8CIJ0_PSICU|nr:hypothetical protein JR316_0010847 [Psilocybe cubensis]KAH9476931.1 hypothetical protein JR316_0010847 [Psilocybe cubensis]
MSSYRLDDSDPAVVYSKPLSGGHWSKQNSGASYQNGVMLTRTRNANATLSFTGTSISVYGLISPSGTGNVPSSFYSVDGQNAKTYTATPTSNTQNQVLFYNSGTLANGRHNLVLINLVELDYLWIDYFEITTANDPPAQPTTAGPPPASSPNSSRQSNTTPVQQTTRVVTQVVSNTVTESSTTRVSVVTSVGSIVVPVSSEAASSSDSTAASSTTGLPAADTTDAGSVSENKTPIGAIVGGVLGGLAVIILALILIILLKRRRRAGNLDNENDRLSPQTAHSSGVVPFVSGPNSSPVETYSPYSNSSSGPSESQYGSYTQTHMGAGHSGVVHSSSTARSLSSAVPTGKRQYSATEEEARASSTALLANQPQREMEQIPSSTNGSVPVSIDDLPPSYQAAAASSQSGVNPALQALANARKS